MGEWIGDKWTYSEQDIKEIREFGHTWYAERWYEKIDERADVWMAINVLKKRHLAISNKSIMEYLNGGGQ